MDIRTHCLDEQVLLDHVFGELRPDELASVDEHLNSCARCRAKRAELARESEAIEDTVNRDVFPSADCVRQARQALHESFAEYEREREPVVVHEPGILQKPAPGFRWTQTLAAAAVIALCLGAAAWFWRSPEPLEVSEVLTRAQSAESALAVRPLFQRFRVELTQVEPQQGRRVGHLETWSDPDGQRFASRWVGPSGSVQHAVWNRVEGTKVVRSVYDPSSRAEIITATAESETRISLLGVGRDGVTTDALAAGFIRWIETRSWQPVSLAGGVLQLIDESGMQVELSRPSDTLGVLRLSARRQAGERVATILLDLNERTYEPIQMRIRFEGADGVAELAMVGEEVQVLSEGDFDPVVFEPRIPGSELSASSRLEHRRGASSAPSAKQPPPPTLREKLDAGLRVLYAIHQAGLCDGRPVEIEQQGPGVVVTGLLNSEQERADVLERLVSFELPPWVSIEIRTLAEASSQAESRQSAVVESQVVGTGSGEAAIADFRLPIQDELEKYFSEHGVPADANLGANSPSEPSGRMMAFANAAVTVSESGLAHAAVLRRLAENYSGAAGQPLSAESAAILREMLADHLSMARASTVRASRLMLPVIEDVAASRGLPRTARAAQKPLTSWRDACMNVFESARRIHGNAVTLLAVNLDTEASGAEAASDTDRALVELLHALQSVETDIAMASRQVVGSQQLFP